MAHVDVCMNQDGVHYPGYFCPHDAIEDEQGPIYPVGWTVQMEDFGNQAA